MKQILEDYGLALFDLALGIGVIGCFGYMLDMVTRG